MEKFSRKNWFLLLLFGTIGQIAWSVENMFFGKFVYDSFEPYALQGRALDTVTLMVQLSGIAATVVTLIAGTMSDKFGNRRRFVSIGYIIWGFTVALFGCLTPEIVSNVLSKEITQVFTFTLTLLVIGDCVMTAFGSVANDAAFNAWVTDNTKPAYRGYIETILSILPLIGLLAVAGGFGILVGAFDGNYTPVFVGLGTIISICGVAGMFLFKDSPDLQRSGSFRDIIFGFRPSVIKQYLPFYATLLSVAVFGIAIQTFMSYLTIFMDDCLGFEDWEYSAVFAIAIIAGAIVNLFLGKISDRTSKSKLLYFASIILSFGLFVMYFASMIPNENKTALMICFGIGGFIMICGNIFSSALNGAILRDNTPPEAAGKMQGIRMVASVLIPMLVGPAIGNALNKRFGSGELSGEALLTSAYAPAREIFLAGAIIALLAIITVPIIRKAEKSQNKQ